MGDERLVPGEWFSCIPVDQVSDLVAQRAANGPEDLADLVDMANLQATTPERLARLDAVVDSIADQHRQGNLPNGLFANIFMEL